MYTPAEMKMALVRTTVPIGEWKWLLALYVTCTWYDGWLRYRCSKKASELRFALVAKMHAIVKFDRIMRGELPT